MKICPNCRQTYSDDNLNFCLTDGSFLTAMADNQPKTVLMDQPRITNQTNWEQQSYQPPSVWQNQQSIQQQMNYPMRINSQNQTLPTISLILGILGVLMICCYGVGIPLGAGAVITGVIALNQEKSDPTQYGGRGLALAGVITGAISLAISLGAIFFWIIVR